ncbi:hypothetical protein [Paenirhodobacter sp.]|uniref:hypothetical protein n=1 Tax=Paenirhodobacter sp. TaxID=1965326 RepID=UPI003B41F435
MAGRERPLFLARRSYRRRRMMDAARLLPILGTILVFVPLYWRPQPGTGATGVYLFAVWSGLILAAFGLARGLAPALDAEEETLSAPDDEG